MKESFKENYLKIFITLISIILTIYIGINCTLEIKKNKIHIDKAKTYEFWNIIKPEKVSIDKIKNFKNILPFNSFINLNTDKLKVIDKSISMNAKNKIK